jgi:hypothetical protein
MKTLTGHEFTEQFTLIPNHLDENAAFDGYMFETFGEEVKYVQEVAKISPNKIWTIVDGEGSSVWYTSGYHFVNRLGYLITEEEWTEETDVDWRDMFPEAEEDDE